jgi:hypothetical protein
LHPDPTKCKEALNRYLAALEDLKLIYHAPTEIRKQDALYYECKSKNPFAWGNPEKIQGAMPWISFLGYQIKYDGKLRIRRSSIRKEHDKHIQLVGKVLKLLDSPDHKPHVSGNAILERTRKRMITMSIGKKDLRREMIPARQPCWADAFYLLNENPHSAAQLRSLDRNREKQLKRLKKHLKRLDLIDEKLEAPSAQTPKYYGAPYSYYGYFFGSPKMEIRYTGKTVNVYSL